MQAKRERNKLGRVLNHDVLARHGPRLSWLSFATYWFAFLAMVCIVIGSGAMFRHWTCGTEFEVSEILISPSGHAKSLVNSLNSPRGVVAPASHHVYSRQGSVGWRTNAIALIGTIPRNTLTVERTPHERDTEKDVR